MALIRCPECGQEVSDRSRVCVHCGYPLVCGEIKITCDKIVGKHRISILDAENGEALGSLCGGELLRLNIKKETKIIVKYSMFLKTTATLPYEGSHTYEITSGAGGMGIVFREINSIV